MEERCSDIQNVDGSASHEVEGKIWQTPVLTIVEVEDVTLGAPSYTADGLNGS